MLIFLLNSVRMTLKQFGPGGDEMDYRLLASSGTGSNPQITQLNRRW